MSVAGKRDYSDSRNQLIIPTIDAIKDINPKYVLIENVPKLLDLKIIYNGTKDTVLNIIKKNLVMNIK